MLQAEWLRVSGQTSLLESHLPAFTRLKKMSSKTGLQHTEAQNKLQDIFLPRQTDAFGSGFAYFNITLLQLHL